jgi:hypothetical protein
VAKKSVKFKINIFQINKNLAPFYFKTFKPKKNQKTKKKHLINRGVEDFVPQNQNKLNYIVCQKINRHINIYKKKKECVVASCRK